MERKGLGEFDTDSEALRRRIDAHAAFGMLEINDWIANLLAPVPGMAVLELGCGIGKQTLALARAVAPTGNITATDLSATSINAVREASAAAGLAAVVSPITADMDNLPLTVTDRRYDRVLASYSIYYSRQPDTLFDCIHYVLKAAGKLFFCGPSFDNNIELRLFHLRLTGKSGAPPSTYPAEFMERIGPDIVARRFRTIARAEFTNPLDFRTAEALHAYWRSYNLYDPSLDKAFRAAAAEYFQQNPTFTTVKRVIGIVADR